MYTDVGVAPWLLTRLTPADAAVADADADAGER